MPRAQVNNGIELEYETFGDQTRPALLLIMGLGVQMLGWDERFCKLLADRGFFVIRFDNRDVGLSTHTEGPIPEPAAADGAGTTRARPTRSTTWPTTRPGCSTTSASPPRTSWACRWAA